MAVSPLVSRSPNAISLAPFSGSPAKPLALRHASGRDVPIPSSEAVAPKATAQGPEPQLAEQLNAEIRHRYIKGTVLFAVYIAPSLTH